MVFSISMKEGPWFAATEGILRKHDITFNARRRRNQIEVRIEGHSRVKKLISIVLPYMVVKRPLAEKLLTFPRAPARNRFGTIDKTYLDEICDIVDFVRAFNKGKNRKHKWDSKTIRGFYRIK